MRSCSHCSHRCAASTTCCMPQESVAGLRAAHHSNAWGISAAHGLAWESRICSASCTGRHASTASMCPWCTTFNSITINLLLIRGCFGVCIPAPSRVEHPPTPQCPQSVSFGCSLGRHRERGSDSSGQSFPQNFCSLDVLVLPTW